MVPNRPMSSGIIPRFFSDRARRLEVLSHRGERRVRGASMKRCESSGTFRICVEAIFAHSRRRRRRSNLPIAAVAAAGWLPHISGARGGGRSPSRQVVCERGPTRRETLKHLFGITGIAASQEVSIRRMPPFKTTSVTDGRALMLRVGVIRKVVTSSSTLDSLPLQSRDAASRRLCFHSMRRRSHAAGRYR